MNHISMMQLQCVFSMMIACFILAPVNLGTTEGGEPLSQSPTFTIENISGGRMLSFSLRNHDDYAYEDLNITLTVSDGFFVSKRTETKSLSVSAVGMTGSCVHLTHHVFGIGLGMIYEYPSLTIMIQWEGKKHVMGTVNFRLIGSFIKIMDVTYASDQISKGYTLFTPEYSANTYLIDNNGTTVHEWDGSYIQGMGCYLMKNGNLIRADMKIPPVTFRVGGVTGHIGIYQPDGTQIWDFDYVNKNQCLHHDIEVLPNGNILASIWDYKSEAAVIEEGWNASIRLENGLFADAIIEIKPTGPTSGEVVWEWHAWDHLIQAYDPGKDNYGMVSDHPERIHLNYHTFSGPSQDWTHINSIDYHEEFDQILLSVRNFNEVWVIDHSTTTEEAAKSTGGRYGKGGDLLYRWGNPAAYQAGDTDDQMLFLQHDARWIPEGYPGEGNILVFNNKRYEPKNPTVFYSSVDEFKPPVTAFGTYPMITKTFGPDDLVWQYTANPPTMMYSLILAGAQRLPNGNTLICDGKNGVFLEVNPEGGLIWQYHNNFPPRDDVFKITRYEPDHPGIQHLL